MVEKDKRGIEPGTPMVERNKRFGLLLMQARESAELSQRELAKIADPNISHSTISRIESGRQPPPDPLILQGIAEACGLSAEKSRELFEGAGYIVKLPPTLPSEAQFDIDFLHSVLEDALDAFYQEGDYDKAGLYFMNLTEAIPVPEDRDLLWIKAKSELALGWVLQLRDEPFGPSGALVHLRIAEVLARQAGDYLAEQEAIKGQGVTYGNVENYSRAKQFYKRVIAADKTTPPKKWSLWARRDLLIALTNLGDFRQIEDLAKESIRGLERIGDDCGIVMFKEAQARASIKAEDYRQAGRLVRECREGSGRTYLDPSRHMILLVTLTEFYFSKGDKVTGIQLARDAREYGMQHGLTHGLNRLDRLVRAHCDISSDMLS